MNSSYFFKALGETPLVAKRLSAKLPRSAWDERTDPERFTPREVVAHLADWEPIFRERIAGTRDVCAFQRKADTHSNPKRTVIPAQSGHPFQRKADKVSLLLQLG